MRLHCDAVRRPGVSRDSLQGRSLAISDQFRRRIDPSVVPIGADETNLLFAGSPVDRADDFAGAKQGRGIKKVELSLLADVRARLDHGLDGDEAAVLRVINDRVRYAIDIALIRFARNRHTT